MKNIFNFKYKNLWKGRLGGFRIEYFTFTGNIGTKYMNISIVILNFRFTFIYSNSLGDFRDKIREVICHI
ncbi:hypothetical protein LCGC14_1332930 [marine sediment metagenome]|uniref:Uncharacterized protein n=1 Tax=marine sediment metagenome TaxID=412755 RepID=A0A0F9KGQ1_9ZZZZ